MSASERFTAATIVIGYVLAVGAWTVKRHVDRADAAGRLAARAFRWAAAIGTALGVPEPPQE